MSCLLKDMDLVDRCWDTYNELIANSEPDREYNKVKTWFKHEQDFASITLCGKSLVNASFMEVIAVFGEIGLIGSYIDFFEKLDIEKQFSNFRYMCQVNLKMPLFVKARDLIVMGLGITLSEEKTVILAMRSIIDEEFLGAKVPKESADYIRIVLNFGFYLITYVDDNHTELSLGLNVDPKVSVVPWFILNSFLKEVAYYIVNGFKDKIEKIDKTEYKKRRELRKEFYDKISERLHFIPTNTTFLPD